LKGKNLETIILQQYSQQDLLFLQQLLKIINENGGAKFDVSLDKFITEKNLKLDQ